MPVLLMGKPGGESRDGLVPGIRHPDVGLERELSNLPKCASDCHFPVADKVIVTAV